MNLFYNGKDIYNDVSIQTADLTLSSGGQFDTLTLIFSDTNNDWSKWNPSLEDTVEFKKGAISSGVMYIDTIKQLTGKVIIKALPVKKNAKNINTKSWEKVTLLELLNEFATKYGFSLKTYNISNYNYERLDQVDETDFQFINRICFLEGYTVKVNNNSIIVYNEEKVNNNITIVTNELIGKPEIVKQLGVRSLKLVYDDIEYTFNSPIDIKGCIKNINDVRVSSIAEAQRFAKNILRNYNKYNERLYFKIRFRDDIAAGNIINFNNESMAKGEYFIYQSIYRFIDNVIELKLRHTVSW